VPLSKIQTDILRLLASQRDAESYVAGATPLNRAGPRYSSDIDIFHDREERVAAAAAAASDAQTLEAAGYGVRWLRRMPAIYTAEITRQGWTVSESTPFAAFSETGSQDQSVCIGC
jgi:uncharacterized protein YbjT (DUF2867 family)